MLLRKGSRFFAILQKNPHSVDFTGKEQAGKKYGPFTVLHADHTTVSTVDRTFNLTQWTIRKL